MKSPLAATFVIVAITALAAWRNHVEITAETRAYDQVQEKASSLAITADSSSHPRRTRPQATRELDTKALAAALVSFAKELETEHEPNDNEQRVLDWQRRLLALDAAAMKALLAELNSAGGSRQDLQIMIVQALAESHPQAALEVIADFADIFENPGARAYTASTALVNGMKSDPAATVAWYKSHRDLFRGGDGVMVTERLLRGTSLIDPKLAFSLIGELEISDHSYAVAMITNPARTLAQQGAALSAAREYIATVQDPAQRANLTFTATSSMIVMSLRGDMDEAFRWIDDGRFTQAEIEEVAGRCYPTFTSEQHAKWFSWIVEAHPSELVSSRIVPDHFYQWVQMDYQAAGEWLAATPEGPSKTAAAGTYAYSLADPFPETAAKWALTLPPGEQRDRLLPQIYQSWLRKDPVAAGSFAAENGIAK